MENNCTFAASNQLKNNDMEIFTTKLQGVTVNVIFTGSHYYFHESFFGIFGVATRVLDACELEDKKFHLLVGNIYTIGYSSIEYAIERLMKRIINKWENKYVKRKIEYTVEIFDGYTNTDVIHVEHRK